MSGRAAWVLSPTDGTAHPLTIDGATESALADLATECRCGLPITEIPSAPCHAIFLADARVAREESSGWPPVEPAPTAWAPGGHRSPSLTPVSTPGGRGATTPPRGEHPR